MKTGARRTGEIIIRHAEPMMGTVVSFDVRPRGLAYNETRAALAQACAVLHRADRLFSPYRHDSQLSRLRRGELTINQCSPDLGDVLTLCEQARDDSDGWFDPWALSGGVDPTGLVKGWAAQQAAGELQRAGVGAGMVNAAGDITVFGQPAPTRMWRVGVRSPDRADVLLCQVETGGAVATSGCYERGEHIRDVYAGTPASAARSVTVCGQDLTFADAFATGLMAAGERGFGAVRRAGYEALILRPDGALTSTTGFPFAR